MRGAASRTWAVLALVAGLAGLAPATASATERLAIPDDRDLVLVNADGSDRDRIVRTERPDGQIGSVAFSATGRWLAFTTDSAGGADPALYVVKRNGRGLERLGHVEYLRGGFSRPDFSPDGTSVVAQTPRGLRVFERNGSGSRRIAGKTAANPEFQPGGRIIYTRTVNADEGIVDFLSIRPNGKHRQVIAREAPIGDLSPDRSLIAFQRPAVGFAPHVFVLRVGESSATDITPDLPSAFFPSFSPDGDRIIFIATREPIEDEGDSLQGIYSVRPDGSDRVRLVEVPSRSRDSLYGAEISPDGEKLAYFQALEGRFAFRRLMVADADGSNPVVVAQQVNTYAWQP